MGDDSKQIKAAVLRGFRQNKPTRVSVNSDEHWIFVEAVFGSTLVRMEWDRATASGFGSIMDFFYHEAASYDAALSRDKEEKSRRKHKKNSDKSFEWWLDKKK